MVLRVSHYILLLSGLIHEKCPFSKTVSSISKYMQRNCLTVNYFVGPLQVGLVMCSLCLIISVIQRYAKILLRKGIEEKDWFSLRYKIYMFAIWVRVVSLLVNFLLRDLEE